MDDFSKACQVLGVQAGVSPEQAKQAYRDMVQVWHPDRFGHDERLRNIAQDKLKEINGAYKVLQAHFFAAGTAKSPDNAPDAGSSQPDAPTTSRRNRAMLWSVAGALTLVLLVVGVTLVLNKGADQSSTSNNKRPTGAQPGAIRYALAFDGIQSRVAIATTGSLTGTFTVECWTMTRRPKGTETVICSRGPKDFTFNIKFREGKRFHGDIGDGTRWLSKMANAKFSYNSDVWYHIAYVVTSTSYTIYVNGDSRGSGTGYPSGNPMLYDAGHRLLLGADGIDTDPLRGCIADMRVWSTARTADQIKANMNRVLTGNEMGLQGYWRFDEGQGPTTADNSGHGSDGALIGNVTWTTNVPPITWQ